MTEYIKREAISEEIRKYYYKNPPNSSYGEGFDRGLDRAQRAILNAPAADVAPVVHGRWLHGDYYDIGDVCSECDWDSQMTHPSYRYCPNCGTRMDEVE